MKDSISIQMVLALLVNKGKRILVCAIVFAVLMGTYCVCNGFENRETVVEVSIDERNQYIQNLEEYDEKIEQLSLERNELLSEIDTLKERKERSVLMRIDPMNKYTAIVLIGVNVYQNENEDLSVDDCIQIASKIVHRFELLWGTATLEGIGGKEGLSTQDVREMVSFTVMNNDTMFIKVTGNSHEEIEDIAYAVKTMIMKWQDVVDTIDYNYSLYEIACFYDVQYDFDLLETQNSVIQEIEEKEFRVEQINEEMDKLQEPQEPQAVRRVNSIKSIGLNAAKKALLGAALGLVLGCLLVMAQYYVSPTISGERFLNDAFEVVCLGYGKNSIPFFQRISNRIVGNHFGEQDNYESLLKTKIQHYIKPDEKVICVSTLGLKGDEIRVVSGKLKEFGINAEIVPDCLNNEVLYCTENCKSVVLVEKLWSTKTEEVAEIVELLKKREIMQVYVVFI